MPESDAYPDQVVEQAGGAPVREGPPTSAEQALQQPDQGGAEQRPDSDQGGHEADEHSDDGGEAS